MIDKGCEFWQQSPSNIGEVKKLIESGVSVNSQDGVSRLSDCVWVPPAFLEEGGGGGGGRCCMF